MRLAGLRKVLLPSVHSSLDVDLRYLPVIRFLRREAGSGSVLEIGSGPLGLAAYVSFPVVAADTAFDGELLPNMIPVIGRGLLPFRDKSFRAVISLDAFEHVPREHRQLFLDEMLRTARGAVVIGFPEGDEAERHDAAMERYYRRQWGEGGVYRFFAEHRMYGIPRPGELETYLRSSGAGSGGLDVRRIDNVNIRLRSLFIRLIWHRRWQIRAVYMALTMLAYADRLFTFGRCYRAIYFITRKDDAQPA